MPRVKRGTVRRAKRKKLEKLTKGYFQNKSKLYKFMKEAADKAGVYAYAGRKQKKRAAFISRRSSLKPNERQRISVRPAPSGSTWK